MDGVRTNPEARRKLRVVMVHNYYQQAGGEDVGVQDEKALLERGGHTVLLLSTRNDHIRTLSTKLYSAMNTPYSFAGKRRMAASIAEFKPDIAHVHNFFPVFSPSIYYACAERRVPVVQTLHNYRLLCPNAIFFRDGKICESCLGRVIAWPGIIHGCYRGSRLGSAAVAGMSFVHRVLGTYEHTVDTLIALNDFARKKFIEGGFLPDKLVVKPIFLNTDPGMGTGDGEFVLFVGRLSEEKGIRTLLQAWRMLGGRIRLRIAGTGALQQMVQESASEIPSVEYLGQQSRESIDELMGKAMAVVVPSEWYEVFPRTILEGFASGTPVIISKLGAMEQVVTHERTGLHFLAGRADDLARQVIWMLDHREQWKQMRSWARAEYEARYSAERNYQLLLQIYQTAIDNRNRRVQ